MTMAKDIPVYLIVFLALSIAMQYTLFWEILLGAWAVAILITIAHIAVDKRVD
jgi:hypothetical protein